MLGSKNPSEFRSIGFAIQRHGDRFQILPSKNLDNFVEMTRRRVSMSPESYERILNSGESLSLANIGITVPVTLSFQNRKFAVFSRRPNGQLAHICGYTPAGSTFSETARKEFLEEFIIQEGQNYLLATQDKDSPYDDVEFLHGTPWSYTFEEHISDFTWVPSITNKMYGECIDGQEELPFLMYLDPYSSSAQAVFGCTVFLPEGEFSLLHAEDKFQDGALISQIDAPLILAEIEEGLLSGDAYTMTGGSLERIQLANSTFHAGMCKTSPNAVCQSDHTTWEQLIG
jgi:hypothetical protein